MKHSKNARDAGLLGSIHVGDHVFVTDGGDEVGAVREVGPEGVVVYVENAGDFHVRAEAIESVLAQKVVLRCAKLDGRLREAIGHAHDAEEPGL